MYSYLFEPIGKNLYSYYMICNNYDEENISSSIHIIEDVHRHIKYKNPSLWRDAFRGLGRKDTNNMTNIKVRIAMSDNHITQWKLARLLGVSESTVWRLLREELPEDEQSRIVRIIEGGEVND